MPTHERHAAEHTRRVVFIYLSTSMVVRGVLLSLLRRLCSSCRCSMDNPAVVLAAEPCGKRNPSATTSATKHVGMAAIGHPTSSVTNL